MDEMIHNLLVPSGPIWWSYDATLVIMLATLVVLTRLMIHEMRR
jgi:hypothetical protein